MVEEKYDPEMNEMIGIIEVQKADPSVRIGPDYPEARYMALLRAIQYRNKAQEKQHKKELKKAESKYGKSST